MVRPRLGFLGVGWIGRDRMRAVAASGVAEIASVADTDPLAAAGAAAELGADVVDPDWMLASSDLDGVVIATPSALHAQQSIQLLQRGVAVFCQKPLGRDAGEVSTVVAAARDSGAGLGVDLSYRHLEATKRMRERIERGSIGEVFAVDLAFHNAYGPDKAWFLDPQLSGGGCVIDLGTHLVDLAGWMLPDRTLTVASSRLYSRGRLLDHGQTAVVEDHATATLDMSTGGTLSVACSWFLHAGRQAEITANFYGTEGAVSLANVDGSFYDFEAWFHRSTSRELIAHPPDAWGGRALVAWARRLADGRGTPCLDDLVTTARLIDGIYGR